MSLETLLTQLGLQRHDPNRLESQLQAMRRDVQRLSHLIDSQTGHWSDQAQNLGQMAAYHSSEIAHAAGRQALRGAEMVRRDPLPAIALFGTALLLARLLKKG